MDFWILDWISGFLDFRMDSGFPLGSLDFTVEFWISVGFLDFTVDFRISVWISTDSVRNFFRDGPLGHGHSSKYTKGVAHTKNDAIMT